MPKNCSYPIPTDFDIIIDSMLEFGQKMQLSAYREYKNNPMLQKELAIDIIKAKINAKNILIKQSLRKQKLVSLNEKNNV